MMNHQAHIFVGDRKAKTPIAQPKNIEILSRTPRHDCRIRLTEFGSMRIADRLKEATRKKTEEEDRG
jgi:hypothetical protein